MMMDQVEAATLKEENTALRAEIARLRAQLNGADEGTVVRSAGPRSTIVGHDVLFAAVEKTRMPMIVTDPSQPDDPIIFVNRAFQELCGYSAEELVGRNCRFLQGPDTDPADVQRIREALREGHDVTVDLLNYRRDGTPFLNELYISPVFAPDGRLLYHFGSQLDVTGYRRDRKHLEAAERWRDAVFDSALDFAIVVTDRDGIITAWNTGAEHVMGWTADERCGHDASAFFTPEDRAAGRIAYEMQTALRDGRASDERWHLRKGEERFWASGEMMVLRDEREGHIGFVKIMRDRTAEHLAGEALGAAEARFRTILDTIEVAFAIVEVKFDVDDRPLDYRFVEANPAFERQAGVNLRGKWVTEFAPNLERFWFETYGHVAKTGEPASFENYAEAFKRWFDVRAVRVGDPAEHRIAILFNDVTARKKAEEERTLLSQEMSHRLKNTLAMVLSIASQTLRSVSDQEAVEAFESRIHALSSAHEVLLRQEWDAAPLDVVANAVLGNVARADRLKLAGPDIRLGPRAALSVSLLLHELATNAAKYGALSNGMGQIELTWRAEGKGDDGDLVLDWEESGGPPVKEPTGRGFGSRLIRMGLVGAGDVALSYPPTGFRAEMRAPVAQLRLS